MTEAVAKTRLKPLARETRKARNRQKIIDATVQVVVQRGLAGLTVARVVERAGVSMGLVNAHFRSKDALLFEVLEQLSNDYRERWREALERAPGDPAGRLAALLLSDFERPVLNLETIGTWFAFRAQARSNPEFLELVSNRDEEQMREISSLVAQLAKAEGLELDVSIVTRSLVALQEGWWTDYFLYPDSFKHQHAIDSFLLILRGLFPGQFSPRGD